MTARGMTYGLLAAIAVAAPVAAQTPAGGEFTVNPSTQYEQYYPAIAGNASGAFVVTWNDGAVRVVGQRFDRTGVPAGRPFQVNTSDSGYYGQVGMGARGDFVVAWIGYDGDGLGVMAQRFDATGTKLGGEFLVNTTTTSSQFIPAVAVDGHGGFIVAWHAREGPTFRLKGQRFDSGGRALGAEFAINQSTSRICCHALSVDAAGNFVVAWSSTPGTDGTTFSVDAQRYDASGAPLGGNFLVNTYTTGTQWNPSVAHAPDGSFAIAFSGDQPDSPLDVLVRRYTAAGEAVGAEFRVNTTLDGQQVYPRIAVDGAANFIVSWADLNPAGDGSGMGLRARRFLRDGTARGADFVVNSFTTGDQFGTPTGNLAADDVGNFVVDWLGEEPDQSGRDVHAQRYGGLYPEALQVDSAGNGVWEPGEAIDVRPAWRNLNGASQAFNSRLVSISGPAGATYTITDAMGDYGTVANGASASCSDCYAMTVDDPAARPGGTGDDPAARPAAHWDAAATEGLLPDTLGQHKRWSLHIGRSFADVPPTGPFYRFVETVLHAGVTAGCGGAQYCPSASTSRAQMAPFVLVAKEGAGFAPAACTTPVFADVPASSPFCRYVEELVRRGVTTGCGGGNYCPDDAVSREQMAVFLLRTLDPALDPPACTTPVFADVPASSGFCRWIEELARRGITAGCGGGNYCPAQPVTREQMAPFLSATFGLTLYGI